MSTNSSTSLDNQNNDNSTNKVTSFSKTSQNDSFSHTNGKELFLSTGTPLPNTECNEVENQLQENYGDMKTNEVTQDIKTLSKTELKGTYPLEYSRWKNMKSRKKKGAIIDPKFDDFSDFLGHMGAVPSNKYTLDRINNDDPTYSPDHCRWADKYTQNSNKGNNVYVTHDDQTHTIAQWATLTKQKANTLYKRKKEGWTDDEVVTGIREKLEINPWSKTPWPKGKELNWERRYQEIVFHEKNISRLDFLIDTSEKKFQVLECQCQMAYEGEETLPDKDIIERDYWKALFDSAKNLKKQGEERKRFITRNNGKDKADPIEAALFDLVNANPMTINDVSGISRHESITDQKES